MNARSHPARKPLFGLASLALACLASTSHAQILGPTPYLSTNDSPFVPSAFLGYFHLDDMEDGQLDTPGVSANIGYALGPGSSTDSVDEDDGNVDGSGLLGTSYLIAGSGNPTGVFTFDGTELGRLPSHVGIVVTDAHDPVVVEAFAWNGASLGSVTITGYGPPPDTQGQTGEDRFVGFLHSDGIRQIAISTQGGGGIEVDHIQYGSLLRPFVTFCPGDGTGTPCPCGNNGSTGSGCGNSVDSMGAFLEADGFASVSQDSVLLRAVGMPNSAALFYEGTAQVNLGYGVQFGDGLRCVGGLVTRLDVQPITLGAAVYPAFLDPALSTHLAPGQTRHYQVWYRNNEPSFCTPAGHNLSNAVTILWAP